jgi:putative ATPase
VDASNFSESETSDLFASKESHQPPPPLAERMRPRLITEVVGQEHLTAPGAVLREAIDSAEIPSIILWGPPGSGKTTLARLLGNTDGYRSVTFSAVLAGVKDIRRVAQEASGARALKNKRTLLFVDEVHRFNKAQQDAFLPHVENGTIVLIGATTENPSFEVNSALLSRCHVFTVKRLEQEQLIELADRAITDVDRGVGEAGLEIESKALTALALLSDGDARQLFNSIETLANLVPAEADGKRLVNIETLKRFKQRIALQSDRAGEEHFNLISALHKSVRGSDPDAALYWLARLLDGGQDPLFVVRRLVRMASEDVGLADPVALMLAISAKETVQFLGMPEAGLALAQATVYMALAPKSNTLETAFPLAQQCAAETGSLPVPLHLRNAPTQMMKDMGFGKSYRYPHDFPGRWVEEDYFPENFMSRNFYRPGEQGREGKMWAQHIDRIRQAREAQGKEKNSGEASPDSRNPNVAEDEAPEN